MNDPRRIENLREFLSRFDKADEHFRESRRQALLGTRELLIVLEDWLQTRGDEIPALKSIAGGLLLGRGAIDWFVGRMPVYADRRQQLELKIEALAILRDLVVTEVMRESESPAPAAGRKDGLLTVVAVIDQEIERLEHERAQQAQSQPPAPAAPGVQWIEVEQ